MKQKRDSVKNFIKGFYELKNSKKELFNDKSFDKKMVKENLDLIKQKRYVIVDEIWNIKEKDNYNFILSFLELVKQYAPEYFDDIEKIKDIINKDIPFSKKFTLDILTNQQKKITDFTRNTGITSDFLAFFSIFTAFPYREAVANLVKNEIDLENPTSGFCPVCGHWPGISYIIEKEGKKIMACICCGTYWSFRRLVCSFCLSHDKNVLGYLNVEGENDISAYTCDKCRRYLKTKKIKQEQEDIIKEWPIMDYMNSGFIDIAAMQNKYIQESILGTRFNGPKDKLIDKYLKNLN